MTDKQAVQDALDRLPESVSLAEIAEELEIMACVRQGRLDPAMGATKSHQEVKELVESWADAWVYR